MSDNKKYYWLKLKYSFFDQKEIKALRKIAGGDTFTIIYLKMQLRSLENDCKLFFEGFQEDFEAELADDINEDVENVKIVVSYLKQHGLIELVETEEGDEYLIHAAEQNTGSETAVAGRVRKHRAKKLLGNNGETKSNPEKELEKSNSKSKIKKLDKEKDKNSKYDYLSKLIYDLHKKVDPGYKLNKNPEEVYCKWSDDIRKLIEIDGRKPEEVSAVICWCKQEGNFWFANIESGKKLRMHFSRLLIQMNTEKKKVNIVDQKEAERQEKIKRLRETI